MEKYVKKNIILVQDIYLNLQGFILFIIISNHLNLLTEILKRKGLILGESQAQMMGLNTKRMKILTILFSTLAVGASVAFAGIIAFVGLLVPHTLRLLGSVDNRFLLPASLLGGALILNLSDLVARTIIQPLELPIGVVTAIIGAPVFLLILIQQKGKI